MEKIKIPLPITQAFCMSCHKRVLYKDMKFIKQNKTNKMYFHKGVCSECGGIVCKISKTKIE